MRSGIGIGAAGRVAARKGRRAEPRRSALWLAALVVAASVLPGSLGAQQRFEFSEPHMGTTVRIVAYADDSVRVAELARRAFAEVALLEDAASDWRDDTEIARLAGAAPDWVDVSTRLHLTALFAHDLAARTRGAFSVTVGPLTRLWRWSARRGEVPDPERRATALALSRPDGLEIDRRAWRMRLAEPGMSLDLGGVAKGAAAQSAAAVLDYAGLPRFLIDVGGDLVLGDPPPGEIGWTVELPGGEIHHLTRVAVATSGDSEQWVVIDGLRYSHIVDPRTGLGVVDAPTVTVIAADGMTADVLASAFSVLSVDEVREVLPSFRAVEARILGRETSWQSPGFPRPAGRTP